MLLKEKCMHKIITFFLVFMHEIFVFYKYNFYQNCFYKCQSNLAKEDIWLKTISKKIRYIKSKQRREWWVPSQQSLQTIKSKILSRHSIMKEPSYNANMLYSKERKITWGRRVYLKAFTFLTRRHNLGLKYLIRQTTY